MKRIPDRLSQKFVAELIIHDVLRRLYLVGDPAGNPDFMERQRKFYYETLIKPVAKNLKKSEVEVAMVFKQIAIELEALVKLYHSSISGHN